MFTYLNKDPKWGYANILCKMSSLSKVGESTVWFLCDAVERMEDEHRTETSCILHVGDVKIRIANPNHIYSIGLTSCRRNQAAFDFMK